MPWIVAPYLQCGPPRMSSWPPRDPKIWLINLPVVLGGCVPHQKDTKMESWFETSNTFERQVGGFNPPEKYWSNWIISPTRGENKTLWKHHLGYSCIVYVTIYLCLKNIAKDQFSWEPWKPWQLSTILFSWSLRTWGFQKTGCLHVTYKYTILCVYKWCYIYIYIRAIIDEQMR